MLTRTEDVPKFNIRWAPMDRAAETSARTRKYQSWFMENNPIWIGSPCINKNRLQKWIYAENRTIATKEENPSRGVQPVLLFALGFSFFLFHGSFLVLWIHNQPAVLSQETSNITCWYSDLYLEDTTVSDVRWYICIRTLGLECYSPPRWIPSHPYPPQCTSARTHGAWT